MLKDKTNLEWVQLNSSGADAYAAKGAVPESTVLTCATGAYGVAISEYMVGMLMACKEGAYLMNVGRGNVIDTKALQDKDVYERFGGIWLDVCETEPLPDNDPLYHIPGLLLTPHTTGGFHLQKTVDNIFDICMNNLKAWCGEGSYKHVVDREAGYSLG